MRATIFLALLTSVACAAPEAGRTAWQWRQALTLGSPGVVRLDLPPATLDASRPSLADLRLISPDGVETPYLTERPEPAGNCEQPARGFKASIIERSTVLEAATGTSEPIEALTLSSPAADFLKSVRVEGANPAGDWQVIAPSEVIFRQAGGPARLTIPLDASVWSRLRVTVDDGRSPPVPFTGLQVTLAGARPETLDHPVTLGSRDEARGSTRLALDLGAGNLHLAELRLDIADPVFSRRCSLACLVPTQDGGTIEQPIGSGSLFRVLGEQGATTRHLAIPVQARVPSRSLVVIIDNGDSPPLQINGATASRYPTTLVFFAPQAGEWTLLTGNRRAAAPRYDLARLRGELGKAAGSRITPGPLLARDDFQPAPALPDIDPAGAAIDLADWRFRRRIEAPDGGVIELEPDALTLANCRSDLGDLRLIQNGRQVPFLVVPASRLRSITPTIEDDPDEQRPGVSRWRLSLPVDGLPARELSARSPAPLFTRTFRAIAEGRDSLGNRWTRTIGSARWTKSGGGAENQSELVLNLDGYRLPTSFHLETDNGDNPPIGINDVTVRFAAPSLVLKRSDPAPLELYYGNPQASPPRYDLRLLRSDLLAADKQPATLGDEQALQPGSSRRDGDVSAGSPWLWIALGLVVAVLLGIVARLLPRGVTP